VGDRRGESCSLRALGVLSISCGRYPEAETCLARSLEVVRQISDRQLEGKVLADQGWLYHCLGREGASLECSEEALQIGREVADRNSQARALTFLGHAHLARQSPAEAAEAYRQSLALRRELAQPHLATEPLAGLARVSLSQGDPSEAQALVDEILAVIESRGLAGTDEPLRVYLTCYRTLAASHDPRAAGLLETGHRLLQERAAKIADDETRRSYLENVAAHRELVREFAETG
jgi:tetratricopeptide (TPR) repeat protein